MEADDVAVLALKTIAAVSYCSYLQNDICNRLVNLPKVNILYLNNLKYPLFFFFKAVNGCFLARINI